jgi:hypothetical protein
VSTASPQNQPDNPFSFSMLRAAPTTIAFRRSTTPFCWGEYGVVSYRWTPSLAQYWANSVELNSPPLSVRSAMSMHPDLPSVHAWKSLITAADWSMVTNIDAHMYRLLSSMSSKK